MTKAAQAGLRGYAPTVEVTNNPPVLITPEMMAAGLTEFLEWIDSDTSNETLVKRIYRAMAWAKPPDA